jgi:hypothetical protein
MNHNPPIWIGKNYKNSCMFNTRILIVGESTYTLDDKDTSHYNLAMAQDHIDGYTDAFRTKLIRLFLNTENETQKDIENFWHSVCYVNFINIPLSGPRIAPEEQMWKDNSQPLSDILDEVNPNLVVALGYRMFKAWIKQPPFEMQAGPEIEGAGRSCTFYTKTSNGKDRALVYALKHPSSAFSWKKEHPFLMKAIKLSSM